MDVQAQVAHTDYLFGRRFDQQNGGLPRLLNQLELNETAEFFQECSLLVKTLRSGTIFLPIMNEEQRTDFWFLTNSCFQVLKLVNDKDILEYAKQVEDKFTSALILSRFSQEYGAKNFLSDPDIK